MHILSLCYLDLNNFVIVNNTIIHVKKEKI